MTSGKKLKVCPECNFNMISISSITCRPCHGARDAATRDPTPEQIKEAIAKLQTTWSEKEEMSRRNSTYRTKHMVCEPVELLDDTAKIVGYLVNGYPIQKD